MALEFTESLRQLTDFLRNIEQLHEEEELTKAHVEHPEDLVFSGGSQGATRAITAIADTIKNPKAITIKWDGYPALIFGTGMDKKFIIADKHMFNKSDGSGHVTSPKAFQKYDMARGIDRSQLHQTIASIWPGLQKSYAGTGFYWGDLLFSQPLQEKNGLYTFRANPNGITYTVEANSDMGKLITGKVGGIAVHQYLPPQATNVQQAQLLNGTIGNLKNNSNVAIVPAAMPIVPDLKIAKTAFTRAQQAVRKYGPAVDQLMNNAPQSRSQFNMLFTVYINKKIVSGNLSNMVNDFYKFFETRKMTDSMRAKLSEYLKQNSAGVQSIFALWIELYNLKMEVVGQLDKAAESSPIKGYLQDGTQTQEGFVSQGIKLVNRMGFSRQNLAGRS
jgi:hypothetical protein